MKKIFSMLLVIIMFMAINVSILPIVSQASISTDTTKANIVPAQGLDEDELPETKNKAAETSTIPRAGLENISIIAIVIITMIGIGSFIRAKTIQIK